jgi:NAD/NADP transhydrogenase beta subunit
MGAEMCLADAVVSQAAVIAGLFAAQPLCWAGLVPLLIAAASRSLVAFAGALISCASGLTAAVAGQWLIAAACIVAGLLFGASGFSFRRTARLARELSERQSLLDSRFSEQQQRELLQAVRRQPSSNADDPMPGGGGARRSVRDANPPAVTLVPR